MGGDGERINLCIVGGGPGGLYCIEPRCAADVGWRYFEPDSADVGAFWNACRTKFRVHKTEMV